jgi:hypothetical protein
MFARNLADINQKDWLQQLISEGACMNDWGIFNVELRG